MSPETDNDRPNQVQARIWPPLRQAFAEVMELYKAGKSSAVNICIAKSLGYEDAEIRVMRTMVERSDEWIKQREKERQTLEAALKQEKADAERAGQ